MSLRVYVKRDEESSIGRGCILYGAHFRPEMSAVVYEAVRATERQFPKARELWLTEGWRNIRPTRDLHQEKRAFDITLRHKPDVRFTRDEYRLVAIEMRKRLGPDYQIVVHGEGANIHIHAELDPR